MSVSENLKSIVEKQKEVVRELENEALMISENDILKENESLKQEVLRLGALYETQRQNAKDQAFENKNLKNALYEHIYNEKIAILNAVNKKIDAYYGGLTGIEQNRLLSFERQAKETIDSMYQTLYQNRVGTEDEIYKKLNDIKDLLDKKVTLARAEFEETSGAFSADKEDRFEKLHKEQVTEEEMKAAISKNNIESLIGLNLINKLGILFLIIGVIAASQFTYFQLPNALKGIFMFAGGGVLLLAGELLNRKKPSVFSLGITGGGVAVLYTALSISYFGLGILDMVPAILVCVLITAASFILSQRYNSQTIAAFAQIGGYLPVFSVHPASDLPLIYGIMVYFVILNLLALFISFRKKWAVSPFIGFALNLIASLYISIIMLFGRRAAVFGTPDLILILYIAFAFMVYTLIPVLGTYFSKQRFRKSDVVLLSLNTLFSSLILYGVFYSVNLSDFTGILAIAFAVIYILLGRLIETKFAKEEKMQALFYLTGFSFVVLIIPFQFGRVWLSLGWLAEGAALCVYGILKEEKGFKRGGLLVFALCCAAFLFFDVLLDISPDLFVYKYLAVTLGALVILSSFVYKKTLLSKATKIFKYAAILNTWFFLIYIINTEMSRFLNTGLAASGLNTGYLCSALIAAVTFLAAYTLLRIKVLSDVPVKIIGIFMYITGFFVILYLNSSYMYIAPAAQIPVIASITATSVLVIINLLSIFAMRDLLKFLVLEQRLGIEWYPLILSAYFIFLLTQNLIVQYNLAFNNALISIIYVLTALFWIIFGFVKRYSFIRKFGLGLSILSVAKLFIVDLSFLPEGLQIVSYFSFGAALIAISYVYHYFSKRLEIKGDVMPR